MSKKNNPKHKTVFLPFFGEFGFFIMDHIRFVHHHEAEYKVICCKPGEEVYFPSADEFYYFNIDPLGDQHKCGRCDWIYTKSTTGEKIKGVISKNFPGCSLVWSPTRDIYSQEIQGIIARESFELKPRIQRNLKVDVVLCCRNRQVAEMRNFRHWDEVVSNIVKSGYSVGIIGQEGTSYCPQGISLKSWEYNDSDAAVEMLRNCGVYLSTDTGVSHLAALLSTPMVIFYWAWKLSLHGVFEKVTKGPIRILEGAWDSPGVISSAVLEFLEADRQTRRSA